MVMIMKSCPALCACLLLSAGLASAQTGPATVSSPDGAIQATFSTVAGHAAQPTGGQLVYEVTYRGKPMIERSNLGLDLLGQPVLGATVRLEAVRSSTRQLYSVA